MSRIVLKVDLGAKLSLQVNGASKDAHRSLSTSHILTNARRLVRTNACRWFTALRKVLEAFLLDENAE